VRRNLVRTISLLALFVAAGHARAQPPDKSSIEAAKEAYRSAEQRALDLLRKVSKSSRDGQAIPPQELLEKIRLVVEESFDARQRLQRTELDVLRQRLADIQQAIDDREKDKQAIIDARIKEASSGKLPGAGTRADAAADRERLSTLDTRPDVAAEADSSRLDRQREVPDFDLETRERLAELDVQATEEDYLAAEKDLTQAHKLYDTGAMPGKNLHTYEKDYRHAALELKRAKVKLEGLAKQRAELEAIADAAIDEALAEQREAMGKLQVCTADMEAANARAAVAEADVEKAKATYSYRVKQYNRVKTLVEEKSVEPRLLDDAEEHRAASKAGLDGAQAALAVARAAVEQSRAAIEPGRAEVMAAEARVRAARLKRSRLGRPGQQPVSQPAAQGE
jgi:multidrug resistance efflux pump